MNLLIFDYACSTSLFGRAGRGGCESRAHLFYSTKQKNINTEVKKFCDGKENCFRQSLCMPLEIAQSLIRAGFVVICVVSHNLAMLSYVSNDMRYLLLQKEGDVQQYGIRTSLCKIFWNKEWLMQGDNTSWNIPVFWWLEKILCVLIV